MKRILAILATTAAVGANAQDLTTWGESGRWLIRIDANTGNGCLMETKLEDETVVHFGKVPNRSGGFFAIYNPDWNDITVGEDSKVILDFEEKRFSGNAKGVALGDIHGGYAFFDNPNVLVEFAKNTTMRIIDDMDHVIEVDLSGTSKAMAAIEACQKEQGN